MSKQHQSPVKGVTTPELTLTPIRAGLIQRHLSGSSEAMQNGEQQPHANRLTMLHREAESEAESSTVASSLVQEALDSRGEPLDQVTRAFMEPRFGHDFSKVRVHRDEKSAESAQAVNALAYTVGQDIVFGAGQYSPQSSEGKKVLAHELAHTIQQGSSVQRLPDKLETTSPSDRAEREADAAAESVLQGKAPSAAEGSDTHEGKEDPGAAPAEEANPAEAETAETELEAKDTPKKSVTVNVTYLKDGSTDISTHLTKANSVFAQANVDVKKGKEQTLDETKSKAILGDDLILDEFTSPSSPTGEETALIKENRTSGTITMYYVKGMSAGSLGEAFNPASGQAASFIYASTNSRTWPHELGHVLLDSGSHPSDADNFMAQTSVATGKEKMTAAQITTIQSSSFVK